MNDNSNNLLAVSHDVEPPSSFQSLNQFYSENFQCNWLIDGVIENHTTGVMYGASGDYKSFIALDMALSVASGKPWHGHKIGRYDDGVVCYIAGEGHKGIKKRAIAWQKKHQVPAGNFLLYDENLQILGNPYSDGVYDYDRDLYTQFSDNLSEIGRPVDLIVFDTLSKTWGSHHDENSTSHMAEYVRRIDKLRDDHGATALIIHHKNKGSQMRGSIALLCDVDYCYHLKSDKKLSATLKCEKLKDAEPVNPIHFEMVEQEANNHHGTVFNSLVPIKVENVTQTTRKPPQGIKGLIFSHIKDNCSKPTLWTEVMSQVLLKQKRHDGKLLDTTKLRTAIKGLQQTHVDDFVFGVDDTGANTVRACDSG